MNSSFSKRLLKATGSKELPTPPNYNVSNRHRQDRLMLLLELISFFFFREAQLWEPPPSISVIIIIVIFIVVKVAILVVNIILIISSTSITILNINRKIKFLQIYYSNFHLTIIKPNYHHNVTRCKYELFHDFRC